MVYAFVLNPCRGDAVFEIDFLPVGNGERSGDAIALRFTAPGFVEPVVGIIDAGFEDDGDALVAHVEAYYGTSTVDFVLSTHPDGDHINGLGKVLRGLSVRNLLIHRPAVHGYPSNSGAKPAEELTELALEQGATVSEPFQGLSLFGGTLVIAGPTEAHYRDMLAQQEESVKAAAVRPSLAQRFGAPVLKAARALLDAFPAEIAFDDAGGTNPRNNSAAITSLVLDEHHFLLPSDAGVPAIGQALDYLDSNGRMATPLRLLALPHHGSRHNIDRDTLERLLGSPTSERRGYAIASVSSESPKYPSPRVANACGRRGYPVFVTSGRNVADRSPDAPARPGWTELTPLPPMAETDHD
jgi:beta-lactamase superfamily II metal-dependent hydrolase